MKATYSFSEIESKWNNYWIDNKCFESNIDKELSPYCTIIPLIDASDDSHIISNVYQDIIIRFKKLTGFNTYWIPNIKYDSLTTENIIMKQLNNDGLTKETVGRVNFESIANDWIKKNNAIEQLKELGCSYDWMKMIDVNKLFINKIFYSIYNKGYIKRYDEQWFIEFEELKDEVVNKWIGDKNKLQISNRNWLGHKVPVWYCSDCKNIICSLATIRNCAECDSTNVKQDSNVLKSWFANSICIYLMFSAEDKEYYSPINVLADESNKYHQLVSGLVLISLIEDKQQILKILLQQIENNDTNITKELNVSSMVKKYGNDVFRFGVTQQLPKNNSQQLFEKGQRFCTKLWNAVRYINDNIVSYTAKPINANKLNELNSWIVNRLNETTDKVKTYSNNNNFNASMKELYNFVYSDYCNCYLEHGKDILDNDITKDVMIYVILRILVILHPYLPYVTEELFQSMKRYDVAYAELNSIVECKWPIPINNNVRNNNDMHNIQQDIISKIRSVKGSLKMSRNIPIDIIIETYNTNIIDYIKQTSDTIKRMVGIKEIGYYDQFMNNNEYIREELNELVIYLKIEDTSKVKHRIDLLMNKSNNTRLKIDKLIELLKDDNIGNSKKSRFESNISMMERNVNNMNTEIERLSKLIN